MGEFLSSLDALAVENLHSLSAGRVLDRVAELVAVVNRVSAELTRTVRHAECTEPAEHDGLKSTRSWLIGHARLSPADAGRIVRSGRALEHFPASAAGFAAGAVTAAQVNVVAERIGPSEVAAAEQQGIDLTPFDEA